jgi:hypothetical protein
LYQTIQYEQEPYYRSEGIQNGIMNWLAQLAENSGVRGCIIKPYGYAIGKNASKSWIECLKRQVIKMPISFIPKKHVWAEEKCGRICKENVLS